MIEYRLMKAEEPDITSKFNSFQEEIIQIGAIDFETDISAMFGKYNTLTFLQIKR